MPQVCHYDPAERQLEKERSRASDAYRLHHGLVSNDELRDCNGFLSGLEIVGSSIIRQDEFA